MKGARIWAASIGTVLALAAAATSLDALGKSKRVMGPVHALASRRAPVVTVDSADEAYRVWKARGLHGRVVLSLSTRLYFVSPEWPEPLRAPDGGPVDPSDELERVLDPKGFLLVAMERGVAREIRHVLPERVYAEKIAASRDQAGVTLGPDGLSAPFFGSPRRLATLEAGVPAGEPVLLFVSASFFLGLDAADAWRRLTAAGLRTDLVVLCRSSDDPEVGAAQREQLATFASLLGAP